MDQWKFEKITRDMERRFGKVRKGEEGLYSSLLFCLEGNLLKTNIKHSAADSRRLKEAICLALHQINSRITGTPADVSAFENENNTLLRDALLMAFDPFTNSEVKTCIEEGGIGKLDDREFLEKYYKDPVMCVLRIKDSVEHWEKQKGSNGYFKFLEEMIGSHVPKDEEMNYTIMFS